MPTRSVRLMGLLTAILVMALAPVIAEVIDDTEETVALYARGERLMSEGDWFHAVDVFEQLTGLFPGSKNVDLFLFQRCRAHYYLGDIGVAQAGFERFVEQYPDAPEVAYGFFFLANSYYRNGQVDDALAAFLKAYGLSRDSRLDRLIESSVAAALVNASAVSLTPEDFGALPSGRRCTMIRLAADALTAHQDVDGANRLLAVCAEQVGDDVARDIAGRQRSKIFRIGLVLPFSGDMQTWADDIHNGAVVATELARPMRIELTTYDTEGDAVAAARIIAELDRKRSTHLAIGPLTSEAAAVATATLACGDLPLIVPAATQAGLTDLAKTAFQLSPNIGLQGIRMAEYAVDSLGARTAGIITSTSPDHLRMARAFAQRFERLGGEVAAIEYYRSRDKDFGPYIRDLKAILLEHHPDSTFFVTPDGDTLDSDGVPAFLNCLYMPGSSQQLRLLLPQVRFYKLQGAYLGSDGWGDEAVYKLGDDVTRLAVFPSPFLGGDNSSEYLEFAAAYDARYGHQPPRLAALGYDAVRLAARAAGSDRRDREDLSRNLSQTRAYHGASGRITFGRNRENIEMPLYRIQSGEAVLLSNDASPSDAVGSTE